MSDAAPLENASVPGADGGKKNLLQYSDSDDDSNDTDDAIVGVAKIGCEVGATSSTATAATLRTATIASGTEAAQKKRERKKQLQKLVSFARTCTLDTVVFTPDNTDIISIGGLPFVQWNLHMLPAFCRALKINVPNNAKTMKDCTNYIIQYKKNGDVREQIKSVGKISGKKKSAETKPACVSLVGSILRVINTLTSSAGRAVYVGTNNKQTRDELDTRKGKESRWNDLAVMYNDDSNTDLDTLAVDLTAYGYTMDEPTKFDKDLTGIDLYSITRYINHWYGKARGNKNVSGQHDPFSNYDFGHGWLYYLHLRLSAIGDTDLMNASYAELSEDVFSLSETSTEDPIIELDTQEATTTKTPTKVEVQKEQVAIALVAKNNAAASLIELQKEQVALELSQMLDKQ